MGGEAASSPPGPAPPSSAGTLRLESADLDSARRDSRGRGPVAWWARSGAALAEDARGEDGAGGRGGVFASLKRAVAFLVTKEGLAVLMAFTTGWANIGCMMRFDAFGTMMTGNSLQMALLFAQGKWQGFLYYVSLVVAYVYGVLLYRVLDIAMGERSTPTRVAPVVFALFLLTDVISWAVDYAESSYFWCTETESPWSEEMRSQEWRKNSPVIPLSVGFGMVNALSMDVTRYVTNAVTGNYQKIGMSLGSNLFILLAKLLGDRGAAFDDSVSIGFSKDFRMPLALVVSFSLGCVLAAALFPLLVGIDEWQNSPLGDQHSPREDFRATDLYFTALGVVTTLLVALHDTAYADAIAEKLGARRELGRASTMQGKTPGAGSGELTRLGGRTRRPFSRRLRLLEETAALEAGHRVPAAGADGRGRAGGAVGSVRRPQVDQVFD